MNISVSRGGRPRTRTPTHVEATPKEEGWLPPQPREKVVTTLDAIEKGLADMAASNAGFVMKRNSPTSVPCCDGEEDARGPARSAGGKGGRQGIGL